MARDERHISFIQSPTWPSIASPPKLKAAVWIWSFEIKFNPSSAVCYTRALRRTIATDLPVNALILEVAADDIYTVQANGKLFGCGASWLDPHRYIIHFEPTTGGVVSIAASQWNTTDASPIPVDFGTDSKGLCFAAGAVS